MCSLQIRLQLTLFIRKLLEITAGGPSVEDVSWMFVNGVPICIFLYYSCTLEHIVCIRFYYRQHYLFATSYQKSLTTIAKLYWQQHLKGACIV